MKIDLSDIYDSCYTGYDDYSAELTLTRDVKLKQWKNESVSFYKDISYGWAFREVTGKWNYGYKTLEEAVTKYTGGMIEAEGYIASRLFDSIYKYNMDPATSIGFIYCKVTKRMFKGVCDRKQIDKINAALTYAFNKPLKNDGKKDE